ncbi:hypothetical protein BDV97DRAFT_308570 [Delphinella strobiligena]|nr:hypothetical protein BDV97DRAFT_308570 [Delphinella strobiligena]
MFGMSSLSRIVHAFQKQFGKFALSAIIVLLYRSLHSPVLLVGLTSSLYPRCDHTLRWL